MEKINKDMKDPLLRMAEIKPKKLTPAKQLSTKFSAIIREWLTAEEIAEVNEKNEKAAWAGCCATHDYCDTNQAMLDAHKTVFNTPDIDLGDNATIDMMNKAWDISKKAKFQN